MTPEPTKEPEAVTDVTKTPEKVYPDGFMADFVDTRERVDAKGIYVNNDGQFAFVKDDADADTVAYDLTSGSVNALNGYRNSTNPPSKASGYIDDSHNLWTEDLNVESAYVNFESDCYVQDDLTVDGKYSKVTLSGVYNGYGAEVESAENSSAILINGAFTTIDFSSLQDLNLAGHAYVGSIHYNANETTDDYILPNF